MLRARQTRPVCAAVPTRHPAGQGVAFASWHVLRCVLSMCCDVCSSSVQPQSFYLTSEGIIKRFIPTSLNMLTLTVQYSSEWIGWWRRRASHLLQQMRVRCMRCYNFACACEIDVMCCPRNVPHAFCSTGCCGYCGQTSAKSDSIANVDLRSASSTYLVRQHKSRNEREGNETNI